MQLVEAVLFVLMTWPAFGSEPTPETTGDRQIRLTQAAIVVTGAAHLRSRGWPPVKVAASLLALGRAESNWARYVWAGECMTGPVGAQCDPHRGIPRALGYWQQHRGACRRAWEQPHGSDAQLFESAKCAASLLQGASHRCRTRALSPEAGAFAGYRGIDCGWSGGRKRAQSMYVVESRLRGLMTHGLPSKGG